jgi:hypothetical protein
MHGGTTCSATRLWDIATSNSSRQKHELGVVLGYQKSENSLKEGGGICPDGGVVVGGGGRGREDTASVTSIDGFGSDTQPIETGGIFCEGRIGADRLSIGGMRVEDGGGERGSTVTRQVEPEVRVFGTWEVAAGAEGKGARLGAIVW